MNMISTEMSWGDDSGLSGVSTVITSTLLIDHIKSEYQKLERAH